MLVNPLTLFPFFALLALFIGVSRRKKKEIEEAEGVLEEGKEGLYADFDFISLVTERFLYRLRRVSEEELAEARKRLSRLKRGR